MERRSTIDGKLLGTEVYVKGKLYSKRWLWENGKTRLDEFYQNDEWTGEEWEYTPDGHLAEITLDVEEKLLTRIIYWQKSPFSLDKYLFVSDSGFYMVKNGIPLDKNVIKPDNIIERESKDIYSYYYIWRDGKKYLLQKFIETL